MARYIVLDADGNAVNSIEWDGITPWSPPEGCRVVPQEGQKPFQVGWKFDAQTMTLVDPTPIAEQPAPTADGMTIV